MKNRLVYLLMVGSLVTTAWADSRTVTLSVPGINCPVCPITVRKALEQLDGVTQVSVSYEKRSAQVVYDDQKTNLDRLTQATADAGYPSTQPGQE